MGMMNTINFLDGASGLVAGVTVILSAVLAIHMIFKAEPPQLTVALLPLALTGAALGFLLFNFAPARIFMGSSGSYFLGFVIAALGIIGGARLATVMMVVGLPALEVGWLMLSRWRRGLSARARATTCTFGFRTWAWTSVRWSSATGSSVPPSPSSPWL